LKVRLKEKGREGGKKGEKEEDWMTVDSSGFLPAHHFK
jgi:hypothetical protein